MEVLRATKTWQMAGAFYVRIQGMGRQHHITLREEFDEHDGEGTNYIVLLDDDFPVATCRFYPLDDETVLIGRVVVLPEYRGQGLGARVIREAEKWIVEQHFSKTVIESRDVAAGFYEKLGYRKTSDEMIKSWKFDCYRMEKELTCSEIS